MPALVILGCGYVGSRLARAALARGDSVRVCARSSGRLAPLASLGAEVKYLDAGVPKQLPLAVSSLPDATIVYSIPPLGSLQPGQAIRAALLAAYGVRARSFIYLSSAGLYGELPDDETWIDETTPTSHDDRSMQNVLTDEAEIEKFGSDRLRSVILRLAPVYGPGRGMRASMRKQTFKIIDDGQHATSRIHVDDAVAIILAAADRAEAGSRFLVADDEPTTQGAYAAWLCAHLGLPSPPSRQLFEPGAPRIAHRNRKVRNSHLKATLGIELRYPTFREGEAAIDAEETAES